MAVEWCKPCKERGRLSIAHREVNGTPMCDECFEGKPSACRPFAAAAVLKRKEERKTMKRIDEAMKTAIREDAKVGMSIERIRKKHGVGWGTARDIVARADSMIPSAGHKRRRRPPKSVNVNGAARNGKLPMLEATPELCDAVWAALPLEKKAALLGRLHEVN